MDLTTARLGVFLAGVGIGAVAGVLAGKAAFAPIEHEGAAPSTSASTSNGTPPLMVHSFPRLSFAQQGEDLIMDEIVDRLHIAHPTYLDIGAHEPIVSNNTFLFYMLGSRGVLVEPNPTMVAKLREVRPGDTVLPVGIGMTDQASADYYMIRGNGELNTFSNEEVEVLRRNQGPGVVERVLKIPLVNVNDVMAKHFPPGGPDIVSIDTEGLDLDILTSLDFTRFRPKLLCAETLIGGSQLVSDAIIKLMTAHDYTVRGATFVNTIFIANELLRPKTPPPPSPSASVAK